MEVALLLFADLLSDVVLFERRGRRVWSNGLWIGGGLMLYTRHGCLVRTGNYAASTWSSVIPTVSIEPSVVTEGGSGSVLTIISRAEYS